MRRNETLSVAIYLANRFSIEEATLIYSDRYLAAHIYNLWIDKYDQNMLEFICALDEVTLQKLIDRACLIYDGRQLKK